MREILVKIGLVGVGIRAKFFLKELVALVRYRKTMKSGKSVITIFGSCRQDSLYETFAVTRIREELTYTHYIEETIQAALYCKDLEKEVKHFGAFRNDLLGKRRLNRKALRKDFLATDVFVVEVASLLEYEYEGSYFHHEAFDSAELASRVDLESKVQINRTKSKIEETKGKLDRLFQIIPKNKTVLVSHISTRSDSDRWKLNRAVSEYATENEIEYFDPSEILDLWPLELICNIEPVISHFTTIGHEIVRDRLSQHIYRITSSSSGTASKVFHNYLSSSQGIGFGDFVFGSIFMKQIAANKELPIEFNLTGHPLGDLLDTPNVSSRSEQIVSLFHDDPLTKFTGGGNYISNRRPKKIDSGDRDFIFRTLLKLANKKEKNEFRKIDLTKGAEEYSTIFHVRFGDKVAYEEGSPGDLQREKFDKTLEKVRKILDYFPTTSSYLLLSDSAEFREYAFDKGFATIIKNTTHFNSQSFTGIEPLINMLNEITLLINARNVIQFSVYPWGSGFSEAAAILGDAKLTRFQI